MLASAVFLGARERFPAVAERSFARSLVICLPGALLGLGALRFGYNDATHAVV